MGPLIHIPIEKSHVHLQTSVFCLKLMSTHVNDVSERRKDGKKAWRVKECAEGARRWILVFEHYGLCCLLHIAALPLAQETSGLEKKTEIINKHTQAR